MKFNVKPSDCRFVVNKDKRTVVCIYDNCEDTFINFITENCQLDLSFSPWDNPLLEKRIKMPNRFIGITTCSMEDEWDEEVGRLIAFSRMKDKLNRSFFKRANTFFQTVDKWLDETAMIVNEVGEKLEINQERRHKHIEKIIGKKE